MAKKMTERHCENVLAKLRSFLGRNHLPCPASGCRVSIVDDKDWSVMLSIPLENTECRDCNENAVNGLVGRFLDEIGVDEERWVFFGADEESRCLEWYFTHPDTPREVIERMDADDLMKESEETESRRRLEEMKASGDVRPEIPIPNRQKARGDSCFLVLRKCHFDEIGSGDKRIEFREMNQYYADKLLGKEKPLKFVRFQLGYGGPRHENPSQMMFGIDSIVLVDDYMDEFPAYTDGRPTAADELPKGFNPTMYGIKLGQRVF